MLKCDKNVDFTKDPEVLFEQQGGKGLKIRDHLQKRAK